MVKPILFYSEFSPAARSVLQMTKILNLDIDLRLFDYARKDNITEEFINPRHTVPTLVDDGEAFYDSHAILTYLACKYADHDRFYPAELVRRAKIDHRLYLDAGVLTPLLKTLVAPIIYNGAVEFDKAVVTQTHRIYDQIETYLARQYLVGDQLTVADISCGSTMFTLEHLVPVDPLQYPRINIWLTQLAKLPDYLEVHETGAKMLIKGLRKYLEKNKHDKEEPESPAVLKRWRQRVKHLIEQDNH